MPPSRIPYPSVKRSDFVRSAAASVAPLIVPCHVLGGPRFVAPSDTVAIGMIGAGGMGASNASRLAKLDGVRIAAIADVDLDRVTASVAEWAQSDRASRREMGETLQPAYGQARPFADYREMLAEADDLDGVVVATPDHAHAALTAMAQTDVGAGTTDFARIFAASETASLVRAFTKADDPAAPLVFAQASIDHVESLRG